MKAISNFQSSEIKKITLSTITGGNNYSPTGLNADGLYTDVWEDSNNDGKYGVGDFICAVEPYAAR